MKRFGALLAIGCGALAPGGNAQAVYVPIFDDGFDCRAWFTDADGDGFGLPGTGVVTCAPPPGAVVRADDCNDGNPAVNPLAIDRPDAALLDANCDGEDGDAERAVHVALTGIDDLVCGERPTPCRTPAFALGRRTTARPDVYVQQGTYPGVVQIVPGALGNNLSGMFGGFLADWTRDRAAPTQLSGAAYGPAGGSAVGVFVDAGNVELGDLRIQSPDATGTVDGLNGRGSYALIARGGVLSAWGLVLQAGTGSAGLAGTGGGIAPTAPLDAAPGSPGETTSCSIVAGGLGGPRRTNVCPGGRDPDGGNGGRGGAADDECGGFPGIGGTALPGQAGAAADFASGGAGNGGSGGAGGTNCSNPTSGANGLTGSLGAAGGGGLGGLIAASPVGYWRASTGAAGSLGDHGGGGGGGGGSGGCDTGSNVRGAGGGGGGAGGCAASTVGGGGGGGGPSVGVFAESTALTITGSRITTAAGGRGGIGGAGAPGQPGGDGGTAGIGAGSGANGGAGGRGGNGGASGAGGGGAGGLSVAILRVFGILTNTANTFQQSPGGPGGTGGATPGGSPGGSGTQGVSAPSLACTSLAQC